MLQIQQVTKHYFYVPTTENKEFREQFSARLNNLLGNRGYAALARKIGKTANAVWNYANGVNMPSVEVLADIADALGVTTDYLLRGEGRGVAEGQGKYGVIPWNKDEMTTVIREINEHLKQENIRLKPEKHAELCVIIYEMVMQEDTAQGKETMKGKILDFMKLAS